MEIPRNSLAGFAAGLQILAKYLPAGMNSTFKLGGDHDVIYVYVSNEDCTPDSEDGLKLQEYGFAPHDGGNWSYST